jgi:hypothetical protein
MLVAKTTQASLYALAKQTKSRKSVAIKIGSTFQWPRNRSPRRIPACSYSPVSDQDTRNNLADAYNGGQPMARVVSVQRLVCWLKTMDGSDRRIGQVADSQIGKECRV